MNFIPLLAFGVAAAAPAHVRVQADAVVRKVHDLDFGMNLAVWDKRLGTAATEQLLTLAGVRALRFPGGSISDLYDWRTGGNRLKPGETFPARFSDFERVLRATHAEGMITANYGTGTPEEAAAWVRLANVVHHDAIRYWEIGNEVYGAWEADRNTPAHNPAEYARRAKAYILAMKAVDPSIRIGVVGDRSPKWTPPLLEALRALGIVPDFLIYHRYEEEPGHESDPKLLQSARTWPRDAEELRAELIHFLGPAGKHVELLCTENNSVTFKPGKQTTSLVNGLFLADSFGSLIQTDFNGLFWWNLRNGQERDNNNAPALYGWRPYGDYGILAPNDAPYPTWEVLKLLSHFAHPGDGVVSASSDDRLTSVYAVRGAEGTLRILLINKRPTTPTSVELSLAGFSPGPHGEAWSYGPAQDNQVRAGKHDPGPARSQVRISGLPLKQDVPAYSIRLLVLSAGK